MTVLNDLCVLRPRGCHENERLQLAKNSRNERESIRLHPRGAHAPRLRRSLRRSLRSHRGSEGERHIRLGPARSVAISFALVSVDWSRIFAVEGETTSCVQLSRVTSDPSTRNVMKPWFRHCDWVQNWNCSFSSVLRLGRRFESANFNTLEGHISTRFGCQSV